MVSEAWIEDSRSGLLTCSWPQFKRLITQSVMATLVAEHPASLIVQPQHLVALLGLVELSLFVDRGLSGFQFATQPSDILRALDGAAL